MPEETMVIPYTSIQAFEVSTNGQMVLDTDLGKLKIKIHLQGPGLLNVAAAVANPDVVVRHQGYEVIGARGSENRQLMEVMGIFWKEVYESTHPR